MGGRSEDHDLPALLLSELVSQLGQRVHAVLILETDCASIHTQHRGRRRRKVLVPVLRAAPLARPRHRARNRAERHAFDDSLEQRQSEWQCCAVRKLGQNGCAGQAAEGLGAGCQESRLLAGALSSRLVLTPPENWF